MAISMYSSWVRDSYLAKFYDVPEIVISKVHQKPTPPHKKWCLGIQFVAPPTIGKAVNFLDIQSNKCGPDDWG
jgi:hypothetical protein